jgi:hypothetical protein
VNLKYRQSVKEGIRNDSAVQPNTMTVTHKIKRICVPEKGQVGNVKSEALNFPLSAQWESLMKVYINPLNAKLNPICHLLALLGARHILHVSRIRVKPITFVPISPMWADPSRDTANSGKMQKAG